VYPAAWQIEIPAYGLSLEIAPLVQDQELRVSFTYWEGAVEISGTSSGMPVNGSGYVELTGYDQDMGGIF
jgi:predicted secreted hydrolase